MPAGCKLQVYQLKKMALRELPIESSSLTSKNQQSSLQNDKGFIADPKSVVGTKRKLGDGSSPGGNHFHGSSSRNGHLVYVRRKVENDHSKLNSPLAKKPVIDNAKEHGAIKGQPDRAKEEKSSHLQDIRKAEELKMHQCQEDKPKEESSSKTEELNMQRCQGDKLKEDMFCQEQENKSSDRNESLVGEAESKETEGHQRKEDDCKVVSPPAVSGESTSASHDVLKAGKDTLEKSDPILCSSVVSTEQANCVVSQKFDRVPIMPESSDPVPCVSIGLPISGSNICNESRQFGENVTAVDDLNRLTKHGTESVLSKGQDGGANAGELPSKDPQPSANPYWKDRYVRLQSFLDRCDQSTQEDYIRVLRLMPATSRSKHAYELERRAMNLLLEEGKELQRMKVLNVLGKTPSSDRSSLSTPTPRKSWEQ